MVNITIFSEKLVDIENESYHINSQEAMAKFLSVLIDKIKYSGERLCIEKGNIDDGVVLYTEVKRW